MRVSRTCTGIREKDGERREEAVSRSLEDFRFVPAYVLLGDPGAGKTTAFEMECEALGEKAFLISARDFRTFDPHNHPEWQGKTLFIDGLDEVRAGSSDARTPFDAIRARLDILGRPPFRLSCREADWLGANDRARLDAVLPPDSELIALRLDPLTDSDIISILDNHSDVDDAEAFISLAHEKGVAGFLENPQTLTLLAKVVGAGGAWPESRKELFEKACEKMVREHNEEHRAARDCQNTPDSEQLLAAAGRLCAVQLISGAYGYTRRGEAGEKYPALDQCDYDLAALRSALATKLFKGIGANRFLPIHRHIAEFLAARHLAGVIKEGVPARRIIALVTGRDGIVVTEMRGLSSWLAAHSKDARGYLIEQDPVGVGLYGDISTFLRDEKRTLLHALKGETSRLDFPGWQQAVAFRALAAQGMEPLLRDILDDSSREKAHQNVVDLVVRVLQAGEPLPGLAGLLLEIVRDDTRWPRIRYPALGAFIYNAPDNEDTIRQLKTLLEDVRAERVADPHNELLGTLLAHLYPRDAHTDPGASKGLSHEILQERASPSEVLKAVLNRRLSPVSAEPQELQILHRQYAEEQRREKEKLLEHMRSNEAALRENRAAPHVLYEIARTYFSGFFNFGGFMFREEHVVIGEQASFRQGVQAVQKWLQNDDSVSEAALQGLRGVIDREDVPDVEEVLRLERERRMHYLGLPFLAGLEEMQRTAPEDDAVAWDDDRIRKAVVLYYCYGNHLHMPSGQGYCPEWYRKLIAERPEIVADVLIQYGRCVFRGGHDYASPFVDKFQNLERDSDHAQVAKHATLPLLRAFPILRAPERQSHLSSLNHLLWAAIKYADSSSFRELIDTKRSLKSIRAAQRVRWLTAAAMVWPEEYTDILKDFVQEDRDNRVRYLKAFFGSRVYEGASTGEAHMPSYAGRELFRFDVANIPFRELLIHFLGSAVGPYWGGDHASDLVRMLIEYLANSPDEAATHALARLADDPVLERWRDVLKQAQDNQRTIRRDAGYRHPGVEQVCKTLDGGPPANPADLAALAMDRLNEIGSKIRRGPTSDWRQYWNVDSYNRPLRKEPKGAKNSHGSSPCLEPEEAENSLDLAPFHRPEDACRDNLLSDLQEKLRPLGIDAQPEGQYANDKRADIRVSYADFNVPVEIKKNAHPKLWSAMHDQLIAKYTVDPRADGYGIYLVFWFGSEYTRTPHENGSPGSAKEMERWLKDSLSPEQARKISVCVIDVSIPEGKSAGKHP